MAGPIPFAAETYPAYDPRLFCANGSAEQTRYTAWVSKALRQALTRAAEVDEKSIVPTMFIV